MVSTTRKKKFQFRQLQINFFHTNQNWYVLVIAWLDRQKLSESFISGDNKVPH